MNIIAAVDKRWGIGKNNQLLVKIPNDQKLFLEETTGKVVVMGRKTLESLPGQRPLIGRTNIILTEDRDFKVKDAIICHSMEETLEVLKNYPSDDIFIIGGDSIYHQFLPYCDVAHVTWVDYAYDADTFLPDLDQHPQWELVIASEEQTYFDICYEFRMYQRKVAEKSVVKTGFKMLL